MALGSGVLVMSLQLGVALGSCGVNSKAQRCPVVAARTLGSSCTLRPWPCP